MDYLIEVGWTIKSYHKRVVDHRNKRHNSLYCAVSACCPKMVGIWPFLLAKLLSVLYQPCVQQSLLFCCDLKSTSKRFQLKRRKTIKQRTPIWWAPYATAMTSSISIQMVFSTKKLSVILSFFFHFKIEWSARAHYYKFNKSILCVRSFDVVNWTRFLVERWMTNYHKKTNPNYELKNLLDGEAWFVDILLFI